MSWCGLGKMIIFKEAILCDMFHGYVLKPQGVLILSITNTNLPVKDSCLLLGYSTHM